MSSLLYLQSLQWLRKLHHPLLFQYFLHVIISVAQYETLISCHWCHGKIAFIVIFICLDAVYWEL